jgi:DNA-binding HxlR family transcriptional regulator
LLSCCSAILLYVLRIVLLISCSCLFFTMAMFYLGNYLSCQVEGFTLSVNMETKGNKRVERRELPLYKDACSFEGYEPSSLMAETAKLRNLITKRGTLEILIPLCCSTNPVRHKKFRETLKGISSKTLAYRLQELEKGGILERHSYNEIPPRVEYRLTTKGQELVESVIALLQWMRKWSNVSTATTTITTRYHPSSSSARD